MRYRILEYTFEAPIGVSPRIRYFIQVRRRWFLFCWWDDIVCANDCRAYYDTVEEAEQDLDTIEHLHSRTKERVIENLIYGKK